MNDYPRMLYRFGGDVELQDGSYATRIVADQAEHEAAAGWFLTPAEAKNNQPPDDNAPPTRAELQTKADELGIKADGRWSDKRLSDEIAAKLKGAP